MIETKLLVIILLSGVLGFILGLAAALIWRKVASGKQSASLNHSEQELKTIFAEQARHHIDANKEAIEAMHARLEQLANNVQQYEASLQIGTEPADKAAFFGEHASVFLRNKQHKSSSSRSESSDAQPLDFSNKASGLFVGNVSDSKSANK